MSVQMIAAADGTHLALHEHGEGHPVILQHGLCGEAAQPAGLFPGTSGRKLLTLECRGHGASEGGPLETFSLARFADDLIAVMETLGSGPLVIGGVSMGAAISLQIAARRPDLVRGLILIRPAWIDEATPPSQEANLLVGNLLAHHDPIEARARFEASPLARRLVVESPDNLASLRGFLDRAPAGVTSALLRAIARDHPGVTEGQIAAIGVPALILGCKKDVIHPIDLARDLAAMLPDARFVEVWPKGDDRARHAGEVRAAIDSFLTEITP